MNKKFFYGCLVYLVFLKSLQVVSLLPSSERTQRPSTMVGAEMTLSEIIEIFLEKRVRSPGNPLSLFTILKEESQESQGNPSRSEAGEVLPKLIKHIPKDKIFLHRTGYYIVRRPSIEDDVIFKKSAREINFKNHRELSPLKEEPFPRKFHDFSQESLRNKRESLLIFSPQTQEIKQDSAFRRAPMAEQPAPFPADAFENVEEEQTSPERLQDIAQSIDVLSQPGALHLVPADNFENVEGEQNSSKDTQEKEEGEKEAAPIPLHHEESPVNHSFVGQDFIEQNSFQQDFVEQEGAGSSLALLQDSPQNNPSHEEDKQNLPQNDEINSSDAMIPGPLPLPVNNLPNLAAQERVEEEQTSPERLQDIAQPIDVLSQPGALHLVPADNFENVEGEQHSLEIEQNSSKDTQEKEEGEKEAAPIPLHHEESPVNHSFVGQDFVEQEGARNSLALSQDSPQNNPSHEEDKQNLPQNDEINSSDAMECQENVQKQIVESCKKDLEPPTEKNTSRKENPDVSPIHPTPQKDASNVHPLSSTNHVLPITPLSLDIRIKDVLMSSQEAEESSQHKQSDKQILNSDIGSDLRSESPHTLERGASLLSTPVREKSPHVLPSFSETQPIKPPSFSQEYPKDINIENDLPTQAPHQIFILTKTPPPSDPLEIEVMSYKSAEKRLDPNLLFTLPIKEEACDPISLNAPVSQKGHSTQSHPFQTPLSKKTILYDDLSYENDQNIPFSEKFQHSDLQNLNDEGTAGQENIHVSEKKDWDNLAQVVQHDHAWNVGALPIEKRKVDVMIDRLEQQENIPDQYNILLEYMPYAGFYLKDQKIYREGVPYDLSQENIRHLFRQKTCSLSLRKGGAKKDWEDLLENKRHTQVMTLLKTEEGELDAEKIDDLWSSFLAPALKTVKNQASWMAKEDFKKKYYLEEIFGEKVDIRPGQITVGKPHDPKKRPIRNSKDLFTFLENKKR